MQPAEIQFAQRLASHEKGIRDRAVKKLRQYISVKTQRETGGRPAGQPRHMAAGRRRAPPRLWPRASVCAHRGSSLVLHLRERGQQGLGSLLEVLVSEETEHRPNLSLTEPVPARLSLIPPAGRFTESCHHHTSAFRSWGDGREASPTLEELVLVKLGRGDHESRACIVE